MKRRKRQQALQPVSTAATIDLAFRQTLLDPPGVPYPLHAAGHADQPALNDFLALETPGLSVQFFSSDTATGELSEARMPRTWIMPAGWRSATREPDTGLRISGIWHGYLETPEGGFFNFVLMPIPARR